MIVVVIAIFSPLICRIAFWGEAIEAIIGPLGYLTERIRLLKEIAIRIIGIGRFALAIDGSFGHLTDWVKKQEIQLVQALDKYKNPKSTKGNKKTTFRIPNELTDLLQEWKKQQKIELAKFNIIQTPEQYVFTYIDTKGNVNSCLHADYLNNKMKSVKRRHPELAHATPHKLRHTGATLAKQAGTSMEAISEALTHSDTITTKTYVNTSNVIPMAVGEIAFRNLKK